MSSGVNDQGQKIHLCAMGNVRRPGWPDTCGLCGPVGDWMILFEPVALGFARWAVERRTYAGGYLLNEGPYEVASIAKGWWRPPPGMGYREIRFEQLFDVGSST